MARTEPQDALRSCPTCGTKVSKTKLGLRDYSRWLAGVLPGRASGSDIDCVVEHNATGDMLFIEFKPEGVALPVGQRILLTAAVQRGIDVIVAWEDGEGGVQWGWLDPNGEVGDIETTDESGFGLVVRDYWDGLYSHGDS